ncbi:MAG TPA: pyridoxal kinase [Rhizomicrobium sp.]|jgi:pyridoxine kinase|nr:pyridoxal kinase [Rhizomicrobium sp.]
MNVLSIQSEVVFGHVGQGAARFALQRAGHEVWALPTVLYSNHAGYPSVSGEAVSADLLLRLLDGLEANGWLARCNAVVSGYLVSAEQAEFVAEAVFRAKRANRTALYCLDPVMGDNGRVYAKPGVAEAIARHLLPLADIVTPNAFELLQLSALGVAGLSEAKIAAERLGRPLVLVTSVLESPERIGVLAVSHSENWFASTPLLHDVPHGAGDLFAALFLARRLNGSVLEKALRASVAGVFDILAASRGAGELRLIAEQNAVVDPPALLGVQLRRI